MNTLKDVEMFVAGLVLDPSTNSPIVIIKEIDGERALPIWIGMSEATAIATSLKGIDLPRPMTHDLLRSTVETLGGTVSRVLIHSLKDNTFFSNIEISAGDTLHVLDSRPSDAIALAVRFQSSIFVSPEVLEAAQVSIVNLPAEPGEVPAGSSENREISDFMGIDKDKWAEILAGMDPDDFKYKM